MPSRDEFLRRPADKRPVVLEGRWLGQDGSSALVAAAPASVLEGDAEALAELPTWLALHARQYPDGAAIGFLTYELASCFESLSLPKFASLPGLSFAYYPVIERVGCPGRISPEPPEAGAPELHANFDERSYGEAVGKIREYLAAGDIYQANLTRQFEVRLAGQRPEEIYERLSAGQAPFRAFLKSPARTVLSNSPERFFRVTGGRILASPIKGTIARSRDSAEDERALARLFLSAKDRAENVMIVDLVRNDLGRVCDYQSIEAQLFEVEPLPQLFHLVSHVRGALRPGVGLVEILRALFPCGSVSGAPKIRAMEILSEIERAPRGVSMGAVGILRGDPGSARCEMDFNVAIRTLTIEGAGARFNVGGGIVYDSRPQAEYEEMMLKARPLLEALGAANYERPRALFAPAVNQ